MRALFVGGFLSCNYHLPDVRKMILYALANVSSPKLSSCSEFRTTTQILMMSVYEEEVPVYLYQLSSKNQ